MAPCHTFAVAANRAALPPDPLGPNSGFSRLFNSETVAAAILTAFPLDPLGPDEAFWQLLPALFGSGPRLMPLPAKVAAATLAAFPLDPLGPTGVFLQPPPPFLATFLLLVPLGCFCHHNTGARDTREDVALNRSSCWWSLALPCCYGFRRRRRRLAGPFSTATAYGLHGVRHRFSRRRG